MSKKTKITDQEKQQFRDAMQGVKPLKSDSRVTTSPKAIKPVKTKTRDTRPSYQTYISLYELPDEDVVEAEQIIHFHRSGIQQKIIKKLRQGKLSIEATLDLHKMTTLQAHEAVTHFIDQCQQQSIRWLCVIHGKGYHSQSKPILKNALNQWLRENKNVLAFHSAKSKHGGTGALYVLIKSIKGGK